VSRDLLITSWQRPATRRAVSAVFAIPLDYLEHGRAFPNQRANAGPDQSFLDFGSSSGRCARSRHLTEDPSTGSDHCSARLGSTGMSFDPVVAVLRLLCGLCCDVSSTSMNRPSRTT
jgi:hypothetical protein